MLYIPFHINEEFFKHKNKVSRYYRFFLFCFVVVIVLLGCREWLIWTESSTQLLPLETKVPLRKMFWRLMLMIPAHVRIKQGNIFLKSSWFHTIFVNLTFYFYFPQDPPKTCAPTKLVGILTVSHISHTFLPIFAHVVSYSQMNVILNR